MPLRSELPRARRWLTWRAAVLSAAIHGAVLLLFLRHLPIRIYEQPVRFVLLEPYAAGSREVELPPLPSGGPTPPAPAGDGAARPVVAVPRAERGVEPAAPPGAVGGDTVAAGRPAGGGGEAADTAPSTPTPRLGDASLWVRPLRLADLPPELREALIADPSLQARIQAIFDSIQAEPGARDSLPGWLVDIPGVGKVGLDSNWIKVGPLRIPAAVLALLPLPQGNIEAAEQNQRLAEMRADLLYAARRAATVDEFKRAVRDLRARKQREREEERARRGRDTVIP